MKIHVNHVSPNQLNVNGHLKNRKLQLTQVLGIKNLKDLDKKNKFILLLLPLKIINK